ncbi:SapC family protein [Gymnodinialimonas sp. 57CJ19]|uniref:SapC family protein n=1 Tax=Gymnodinialimonas sp. 57CJ19 TaxID=3138498 RepID=UPI0031343BC8
MTKQLMIYDNVVPVNRETHRDMSIRQITSFAFAKEVNSVPIVDVEFSRICSEAPIVFAKTETGLVSLALLGTQQDRNGFVDEDNGWTGAYVPAFFRRYPFVFAVQDGSDQMTLCIDEGFEGLNNEGKGERMFDSEGQETSYLRTVLRFAEEYQSTFNRTQAFCDRLEAADLLEEARVDFTLSDGTRGGVTGFLRVSAEKFRAISDEQIVSMFRTGDLEMIQMHLLSMQQVEAIVTKSASLVEGMGLPDDAAAEPAGVH